MKHIALFCCLGLPILLLSGCKNAGKAGVVNNTNGQQPVQQPGTGNQTQTLELSYVDAQQELVLTSLNGALQVTAKKALSGQDRLPTDYNWAPGGAEVNYAVDLPDQFRELKFVGVGTDGATGVRATLKEDRETDALCSATWSPDGSLLAVDYGTSMERGLRLLDAATLKPVAQPMGYSMQFAWSPDGSLLAMGIQEPVNPPLPIESGASITTVLYHVRDGRSQIVKKGNSSDMYSPERWLGPDRLIMRDMPAKGGSAGQFLECRVSGDQINLAPFDPGTDPTTFFEAEVDAAAKADFNASDVGFFAWSPDQKWLAFEVFEKDGCFIYATPADNYSPVLIDKGWFPEWRPAAISQ